MLTASMLVRAVELDAVRGTRLHYGNHGNSGWSKIFTSAQRISVTLLLAALLARSPGAPAQAPPPQLVLLHGRILTMDSHDSTAQGLAVRDGKITAIGTDRQILSLAGAATRR